RPRPRFRRPGSGRRRCCRAAWRNRRAAMWHREGGAGGEGRDRGGQERESDIHAWILVAGGEAVLASPTPTFAPADSVAARGARCEAFRRAARSPRLRSLFPPHPEAVADALEETSFGRIGERDQRSLGDGPAVEA